MSSFNISLSIKYEISKLLQFPRASSGGFKQAKKKGSFSQTSKKKLNIQISVNIFMLTWEATTINIPLGHYGFRSFKAETESKKSNSGHLEGFGNISSSNNTQCQSYFAQIFPQQVPKHTAMCFQPLRCSLAKYYVIRGHIWEFELLSPIRGPLATCGY